MRQRRWWALREWSPRRWELSPKDEAQSKSQSPVVGWATPHLLQDPNLPGRDVMDELSVITLTSARRIAASPHARSSVSSSSLAGDSCGRTRKLGERRDLLQDSSRGAMPPFHHRRRCVGQFLRTGGGMEECVALCNVKGPQHVLDITERVALIVAQLLPSMVSAILGVLVPTTVGKQESMCNLTSCVYVYRRGSFIPVSLPPCPRLSSHHA